MLVCVKERERLYNCSEWLVIQVGLEWRGRLVMQPQLEMSLCHCECVCVCVCVCVFVMCVFWLITRISQLYCSTDPLWSALQTLSPFHLSSLHPFCSLLFLLSLSAPKSTSDLSLFICSSHRSLSLTLFVCVCVCVLQVCVCVWFASVVYVCLSSTVCVLKVCLYPWLCEWLCECVRECVCVCVCLRTRAIREQYMMYPVEVLNILMHRAANLAEPHTRTSTHTQELRRFLTSLV